MASPSTALYSPSPLQPQNHPLPLAFLLSPQYYSRPCIALPDHTKPVRLAASLAGPKNNPYEVKMKFQKIFKFSFSL